MIAIIILLVTAAKVIAIVISEGDKGAYKISTILPWIFPIINDEEEWEKDCCIICIAIKPGAKKLIKETPKTFPLSEPMAKDKTKRNNKDEIKGENIVCTQTIKNLKTSFYKESTCPSS